ncbi:MAG: B12-binding domain-containing radical SAM protein [Peptococcaceae bacterium]|jgi:radical SAM superfamily enzyme YgiQ (UPF0313 family)|nr:B12-binding domain-containing radical SAM protein [Peptococcaceae bacterium]
MMKILFINPSVDKYNEKKIWTNELTDYLNGRKVTTMPRLVPMILGALTPKEHRFVHIDEEIEDIDFDITNADFVGITAMSIQANRAYEIADEFRRRGVKVAIGGIHASALPDEASQHADTVCVGEGENIWPVMLKDFEAGNLKPRYEAKDYPPVTKLVSPRIDVIKPEHYTAFPLMTSKGCPYDCDFCSIRFSSGNKIRMKPVSQVIEEVRAFEKHNHGLYRKPYQFVDDNLYLSRSHLIELFTALKKEKISWSGQGTVNSLMDEEVLELMSASGCRCYHIGFESISEASLKEANKTTSNKVEDYDIAIKNLVRHGIAPAGFFILGFDNDDKSIFRETLNFAMEKNLINPYFNTLTPYPGTRLYERIKDRIFDKDWSHYSAAQCVFTPAKMTPEEFEAGKSWSYNEITKINVVKKQIEEFWSHGPWKSNPKLNIRERILLFLAGVQLARAKDKDYKEYSDFCHWAAKQKNATSVMILFQAIFYAEGAKNNFRGGHNPE